jgi:two-component system sensor histidine kinase ChvG
VRIADSDLIAGDVDQIELPPLTSETPLAQVPGFGARLEQIGQMFL